MKIAIFSSWLPEISNYNRSLAQSIAKYLSEKGITVVTGGCSGIPALVVEEAYRYDAEIIGYFPHHNKEEYHKCQYEENIHTIEYYSEVHFIAGFTARSLSMIKNVDAALVLNGRIGTLSECTIAIEEGLPIAVIEGSGGMADELKNLIGIAKKEFADDNVIFTKEYEAAIDTLIENYKKASLTNIS